MTEEESVVVASTNDEYTDSSEDEALDKKVKTCCKLFGNLILLAPWVLSGRNCPYYYKISTL